MPASNPYHNASDAYSNTAAATDQRSLEGKVLMKAAMRLEQLSERLTNGEKPTLEEISEAVEYNQKLWTLFLSETMNEDHPLPQEIKNNIASLGTFVFKRTIDVLADTRPEKIRVLIDINRNIASGLLKSASQAPATPAQPPAADTTSGKTDSVA